MKFKKVIRKFFKKFLRNLVEDIIDIATAAAIKEIGRIPSLSDKEKEAAVNAVMTAMLRADLEIRNAL